MSRTYKHSRAINTQVKLTTRLSTHSTQNYSRFCTETLDKKLDEDDLEAIRRKRIEQMKKAQKAKKEWAAAGHGSYTEISDQKEFFAAVRHLYSPTFGCFCTNTHTTCCLHNIPSPLAHPLTPSNPPLQVKRSKRVVCHFYRPTTWRCGIIDKHIGKVVAKHPETKFIKIDAEKSPYLVDKLKIWMLPSLVLVKDGHTDHTIVGFDEFGGNDDFTTGTFEATLLAREMLLESFCG